MRFHAVSVRGHVPPPARGRRCLRAAAALREHVEARVNVQVDGGRGQGDAAAARRFRARSAWAQAHGLLQGLQRQNKGPDGQLANTGAYPHFGPASSAPLGSPAAQYCVRAATQAVVKAYTDRTFTFETRLPAASYFLLRAAGVEKGAMNPGTEVVGQVTVKHIYHIAKVRRQRVPSPS